jgi:acyl-CoA thioester hydrolase
MKNEGNGFFITVRARYADVDKMGVVYHGRYFEWFESARTEMLRERGLTYARFEDEEGFLLPVTEAQCKYLRPVRYDEVVRVYCDLLEASRVRLRLDYRVEGEGVVHAEGWTRHCFTNRDGNPTRIPKQWASFFENLTCDSTTIFSPSLMGLSNANQVKK